MPALAHIIRRRHNRKRRRQQQGRRSALWLFIILGLPCLLLMTPFVAGLGLSLWLYTQAAAHAPEPVQTAFLDAAIGETRFYDRGGKIALHSVNDPLGEGRRWLQLADLPGYVIDAALLSVDFDIARAPESFDAFATLSQMWRYIIGAPLGAEDGLAGRLAREAMLPWARASGLDASLLEIVFAAENRRRYSPAELLEWRLNSSYFGRDAFGLEAAAQVYLGKSAHQLSLAEAALLAPIAGEPRLNPLDHPQGARERGDDLLFALLEAALIDRAQFDAATAEAVNVLGSAGHASEGASAFLAYARRQAENSLTQQSLDGARLVARGGLKITTSLDADLQGQAECLFQALLEGGGAAASARDGTPCLVARGLSAVAADPPDDVALAMIDVASGQILSMAGAATAARHQPAVLLHPFVYMDAFLRREYTPASMVYDLPRAYPGPADDLIYTPSNADGRYRGPMNLRDAMAAGLTPPAAQVAGERGLGPALELAGALGFSSLARSRPELALLERGGAVAVLDAAYAYSVLAADGMMRGLQSPADAGALRGRDPIAVLKIEAADGELLWAYAEDDVATYQSAVIEPSLAFMVNDILADSRARARVLGREGAAFAPGYKTAFLEGRSADGRDSWRLGYTTDLLLALQVGWEDAAPSSDVAGEGPGPTLVWRALMDYALAQREAPADAWQAPAGIEEYLVCEISGMLPPTADHCPTRLELVPRGSQLRRDDRWRTVEINRADGLLATVNTPDDLREDRAYFVPPEAIMDWWTNNDMPLPPSTYSADGIAVEVKPARLTAPADYAYLGARVEIRGEINRPGAVGWLLEYGAEANPERWTTIAEGAAQDANGGITAAWETALLSGIHTLRLRVSFSDGSVSTDSKLLTFDNTPPAIRLATVDGLAQISAAAGKRVSLMADVRDNLTIDRVEFYREEDLVAVDSQWPYGAEMPADAPGVISYRAVAFDQVGNRAQSTITVTVEGG